MQKRRSQGFSEKGGFGAWNNSMARKRSLKIIQDSMVEATAWQKRRTVRGISFDIADSESAVKHGIVTARDGRAYPIRLEMKANGYAVFYTFAAPPKCIRQAVIGRLNDMNMPSFDMALKKELVQKQEGFKAEGEHA